MLDAREPATRAGDVHEVTRNPTSENPLSPIPTMKTVSAAVRLPAGRNPDGMRPGRPDPVTAHPIPISAAPIPESVHPHMPGTGRITHRSKRPRRRWRGPHGDVGVPGACGKYTHQKQYKTEQQNFSVHRKTPPSKATRLLANGFRR